MNIHHGVCAFMAMILAVVAPSLAAAQATNAAVMTRNVYIGSDLSAAFDVENPGEIPAAAGEVLANILASNFPARAALLAEEIASKQPYVVGLQEVYDIQAEVVIGSAPDIDLDFLQILLSKLAAHGQQYSVAVQNQNVFAPVPLAITPAGGGVERRRLRIDTSGP